MNTELTIWNDHNKIRSLFAPKLTDDEFQFFIGLGKGLGANPFLREIWAVKYRSDQPANVFLGRDFYRRKAQEQPDYDGHLVDSVYSKDGFEVINGEPKHTYNINSDRGHLVGAYCIVRKKNIKQPFYVFVRIEEYQQKTPVWTEKPDTMIKKVAEAQALRGAYQGLFAGTYDESEMWAVEKVYTQIPESLPEKWDEEVKQKAIERKKTIEPDVENKIETISKDQQKRLFALANEVGMPKETLKDIILSYGYEHTKDIAKSVYQTICDEVNTWRNK